MRDLPASKCFYSAALEPLGIALLSEKADSLHFGRESDGRTMLWLHTRGSIPGPIHISFEADAEKQVRAFHAAGLSAGGADYGEPGIREAYSPNYFAAFLLDPDGHNVEAIFRK